MATIRIPYLTIKPLAGGGFGYYWQPSPLLARKGWKPLNLGAAPRADDPDKLDAARRRNTEVEAWRAGGAAPRAIKKFTRRETMAGLIALYKESDEWTKLAASTRHTYDTALNIFTVWATDTRQPGGEGNLPLAVIDRARIERLRDNLMKPEKKGQPPRHYRAHNSLRVLRTLLQFAEDRKLIDQNPATRFKLAAPAPRDQIWEVADVDAFKVAAHAIGYPSLAFAVELAEYTGQREADILKMSAFQWREIKNLDRDAIVVLAGPDGRVMGIHVSQLKMQRRVVVGDAVKVRPGRWVGIPIVGDLRLAIEKAIADNAARKVPATTLLVDDRTGRPWLQRWFLAKFAEARAWAIDPPATARKAGVAPRPELADLQFRDLRRTCVVRLGELGLEDALVSAISGHNLATIKTILEVYMPRTSKMAGRAIVARIGEGTRRPGDEEKTA